MAHQHNYTYARVDEYGRPYFAPRRPDDAGCVNTFPYAEYQPTLQPAAQSHYPSHQQPQYLYPSTVYPGSENYQNHECDLLPADQAPRYHASLDASSSPSSNSGTDGRDHHCDFCGKYFERPHDVKRHRKSHFPGTYYCLNEGCPRTEKPFKRNDECKTHMRQHCKFTMNAPPIQFEQRRTESYYPGFM